jgi:hypothetical protein
VRRPRNTPEQIIRKLREADRMLGEGKSIPEAAKRVAFPSRWPVRLAAVGRARHGPAPLRGQAAFVVRIDFNDESCSLGGS